MCRKYVHNRCRMDGSYGALGRGIWKSFQSCSIRLILLVESFTEGARRHKKWITHFGEEMHMHISWVH